MIVKPIHHIANLSLSFYLFTAIQVTFLLGWEIQEILGSTMRLLVIAKEIEGTLDVRYLFRVKTELVTITGKTDDTVYRLTEDVARFEQQKTKTTDDM